MYCAEVGSLIYVSLSMMKKSLPFSHNFSICATEQSTSFPDSKPDNSDHQDPVSIIGFLQFNKVKMLVTSNQNAFLWLHFVFMTE